MPPKKIMIVRHGEKPEKKEDIHGVNAEGQKSKRELSTQGWQRAGALVRLFNPLPHMPFSHAALARPSAVFAAGSDGGAKSMRAQHTVEAVATSLKLKMKVNHRTGQEKLLVKAVMAEGGVVLIAWEHDAIVEIANLILGTDEKSPQKWHGSRFDLVWVFEAAPDPGKWNFSQVPQMVLPTDVDRPM